MKFFTGPVAIVLEAGMLHVSILFLTNTRATTLETRFRGTKKYSTYVCLRTIYAFGPYFWRATLDPGRPSARVSHVHYPMDALPTDIATAIHGYCGLREIGYTLGCCAKAWRVTDAAWKRLASRHPLTRLAVKYVSSDQSKTARPWDATVGQWDLIMRWHCR